MKKCTFLIAFVVATVSVNAQTDLQNEIEGASQKMSEALYNGDIDSFAKYFDDDVSLKMSGHETLKGVEAVVAAHKPMADQKMKLVLNTSEVIAMDGFAYETGDYQIQTPDGQTVDKGSYGTLWKNVDGTWKIYRDVVSTAMSINGQGH